MEPNLQLSLDGVQECRGNSISLDVYSIKFDHCRCIYPLKIIRPINKFNVPYKPQLLDILTSFHNAECILKHFIGDNPKRATVREALNFASNYGCEYCTCKAERYRDKNVKSNAEVRENELKIKKFEKSIQTLRHAPSSTAALQQKEEQIELITEFINELKKRNAQLNKKQSHTVWPSSTSGGPPRTKEGTLAIVLKIEDEGRSQLTADDVKGIVGRSLFLDIQYFDYVSSIPCEYMHSGCIGVVKR